jgi:hypothetical protein
MQSSADSCAVADALNVALRPDVSPLRGCHPPLAGTPHDLLTRLAMGLWDALRSVLWHCPRLSGALFDIASNKPADDLGRRRILLGAQALEEGLLAGVDEDRQSCSTIFECHGRFLRMRRGV